MSWQDSLSRVTLPDGRVLIGASFRGVPFLVESTDRAGGRRTVVHEFPLRDVPVVEDLGRRSRTFTLEGYVIGDDYVAQRNALLAALEDEAGPGELVHPYHGTVRAVCSSLTVRESIADGGMARFGLEFTEAPALSVAPSETPDLAAQVETSADTAVESLGLSLEASYSTGGQPSYALQSLEDEVTTRASALGAELEKMVTAPQELARLDVEIQSIISNVSSLVRTPSDIIESFQAVLDSLADTIEESPRKVVQALIESYDVAAQPLVEGITATRDLERDNQEALTAALRQWLAIEAARLLPAVVYETIDDAISDRDAVAIRLEEQASIADDTAYPALVQLRADVLRAVPGDTELARLVPLEQRIPIPSLLLSYRLYGTVESEVDIIARNGVQHPGFVSGSLEVLSDG